jgi:heat-inducible transcriptional repressor
VTNYAALVVGPGHEAAAFRSVQLVSLSNHMAMLVAVLSNGAVENEPIDMGDGTLSDARVSAASAHLTSHLVGMSTASIPEIPNTGDEATDALCETAMETLRRLLKRDDDQVFIGGAAHMAAAFDAVEVVRNVLTTLEQQYVVVTLLRDVLDRGLSVAIGSSEHGIEQLAACSIVVAPYQVDGEPVGTIGVLGPTRMNYPEALAAVDIVSERLGRRLSEG